MSMSLVSFEPALPAVKEPSCIVPGCYETIFGKQYEGPDGLECHGSIFVTPCDGLAVELRQVLLGVIKCHKRIEPCGAGGKCNHPDLIHINKLSDVVDFLKYVEITEIFFEKTVVDTSDQMFAEGRRCSGLTNDALSNRQFVKNLELDVFALVTISLLGLSVHRPNCQIGEDDSYPSTGRGYPFTKTVFIFRNAHRFANHFSPVKAGHKSSNQHKACYERKVSPTRKAVNRRYYSAHRTLTNKTVGPYPITEVAS